MENVGVECVLKSNVEENQEKFGFWHSSRFCQIVGEMKEIGDCYWCEIWNIFLVTFEVSCSWKEIGKMVEIRICSWRTLQANLL